MTKVDKAPTFTGAHFLGEGDRQTINKWARIRMSDGENLAKRKGNRVRGKGGQGGGEGLYFRKEIRRALTTTPRLGQRRKCEDKLGRYLEERSRPGAWREVGVVVCRQQVQRPCQRLEHI